MEVRASDRVLGGNLLPSNEGEAAQEINNSSDVLSAGIIRVPG